MNKNENIKYANLPIIIKGKINKEEKINNKSSKIITAILIIILTVILLLSGYAMAKTIEEVLIKTNMQIAEPIFTIENMPSIDITAEKNYGIYNFKIKNYNEKEQITETDLQYYIEILGNIDNSINIELYQNENQIKLKNNKISKDKKEEREYKIKILYEKNKNDNINDILENIQVKIHTEQMKV